MQNKDFLPQNDKTPCTEPLTETLHSKYLHQAQDLLQSIPNDDEAIPEPEQEAVVESTPTLNGYSDEEDIPPDRSSDEENIPPDSPGVWFGLHAAPKQFKPAPPVKKPGMVSFLS